jgi:CRISPR system Cascade subunit CasA
MTISFNLIEEKWIPCLGKNKDYLLLNIREVISQAHNLTGLAADLPIMNAAMFLFLLAFTSSAHPMKDLEDWDRLYQNSRFPEAATEEYINRWHIALICLTRTILSIRSQIRNARKKRPAKS